MEPLHFNLNSYHAHAYRRLNSGVGLVLMAVGVWLTMDRYSDADLSLWHLYLPISFLLIGALQILISNGYSSILGKMFFRIDQDKIEYKVTWLSKTKTLCWNSIELIDMKMTELRIKTTDGQWKTILLDHLSENEELRQIKNTIRRISKIKNIRVI